MFRNGGNLKLKQYLKGYVIPVLLGFILIVTFQNCGKFALQKNAGVSSFASSLDVTLRPPTEFAWYRRYIFLVDMSYSMVSGPCPFDVDVSDSTTGFTGVYRDYDPNFPTSGVNYMDARARVADCSVDTSLSYGNMKLDYSQPGNSSYLPNHKTFKGNDFEGNRFKIIRKWIEQMRNSNNQEFLERTEILLVPAAGGVAYERLLKGFPMPAFKFVTLTDPILDQSLSYLENVHSETANHAQMPAAERFTQFDPNLESLKMGTTSLISAYDKIFNLIDVSMEQLATSGNLTHSTFKLISFGDTRVNPLQSHYDKALGYFPTCLDCSSSLEKAWGRKQDDELESVDLKLSLIQGLTKYYGSGFFDADFFDMRSLAIPDRIQFFADNGTATLIGTEFPADQKNVIEFLDERSAERKASTRIYKINSEIPPYRIANSNTGITTFKTTHIFILNSNFKVDNNGLSQTDADGDGLPDDKEAVYGFDPITARTNKSCLDSLMIEEGFKSRCESLAISKLCNALLDSDGDGLNECEEMTIGTDPFDFDTDGDGIPDSTEILYSLNPLNDDAKTDSNGDGLTNIMNLGKGLNPSVLPAQVPTADLINILLNYVSQQSLQSELLGEVHTDIFKLDLLNFPLRQSPLVSSALSPTYLIRPGSKGFSAAAQIPEHHLLIKPLVTKGTNKLVGILRVIDPDEPLRVYWETFELELDTRFNIYVSAIDLSKFSQMKVIDRVRLTK